MPLPKYKLIKSNYCVSYYGLNKEYIVQLKLLRPNVESMFKNVSMYICCSEDCQYLLRGEKNILKKSEDKSNMAYIRTLENSIEYHPVENLLKESGVVCGPVLTQKKSVCSKKCALLTKGIFPTRSLTGKQINQIENELCGRGYKVYINPKIEEIVEDFELVVGVENEVLYEAAGEGINTSLVPTGIGENIFRAMFPDNIIFKMQNEYINYEHI